MPAYKDKNTGKWYAQVNYQDREGNNKQKKKRGFKTKREALEWEDDFKRKNRGSISMKFKDFADLYLSDMENRLKPTTMQNKRGRFKIHLTPFFGEIPLNEITVIDVRKWQNLQQTSGLAQSTIRKNHTVLSTLFNYAVRYYGLQENPCQRAGTIGSVKPTKFEIWTLEEYQEFIQYIDNPAFKVAFDTLFYTGLRIGELTALTPADFDFSVPKLTVNKNYVVVGKDSYIYEPKTAKSNRDVILPRKIAEEIKEYIQIADYGGLKETDRIFTYNKESYRNKVRKVCEKHNLKRIKIHEFRHSHASMLIEMGFNPLVIAERLGHENVNTTLNIYSHLYPDKQLELSQQINEII